MKEEVKQEIKEEVKQEITEEVKQEITEEVKQEITEEVKQEIKEEVKQEIKEEVVLFKHEKEVLTDDNAGARSSNDFHSQLKKVLDNYKTITEEITFECRTALNTKRASEDKEF